MPKNNKNSKAKATNSQTKQVRSRTNSAKKNAIGTGGLKQPKSLNTKKIIVLVLLIALVGGSSVFISSASSSEQVRKDQELLRRCYGLTSPEGLRRAAKLAKAYQMYNAHPDEFVKLVEAKDSPYLELDSCIVQETATMPSSRLPRWRTVFNPANDRSPMVERYISTFSYMRSKLKSSKDTTSRYQLMQSGGTPTFLQNPGINLEDPQVRNAYFTYLKAISEPACMPASKLDGALPTPFGVAKKGDYGLCVVKAQDMLKPILREVYGIRAKANEKALGTPGLFTKDLEDTIKDFQRKQGLEVNGIFDSKTYSKLHKVLSTEPKTEQYWQLFVHEYEI